MNYLSVASGISAETLAWSHLGWKPVAFAQFDPDHNYKGGPDFASAVLAHHYPDVPNLGDMTKYKDWPDYAALDVLAGGTPCQTFSLAGLGAGLDDPRGNLALVYGAIARRYRPKWVVWENVVGVLSNDEGRSFASLLGLLSGNVVEIPRDGWRSAGVVPGIERAYGLAWRVLDTQFVRSHGYGRARPQRRRRVFVVGRLGDYRRAAAVLFEPESMSGNPPPSRRPGQVVAGAITRSFGVRGGVDEGERGTLIPEVANPLTARMFKGVNTTMDEGQTMIPLASDVAPTLSAREKGGGGLGTDFDLDGGLRAVPREPVSVSPPLSADADKGDQDTVVFAPAAAAAALTAGGANTHGKGGYAGRRQEDDVNLVAQPAIAFQPRFVRNDRGGPQEEVAYPLTAEAGRTGKGDSAQVVAFQDRFRGDDGRGYDRPPPTIADVCGTLETVKPWNIISGWSVRRLMPIECERLQGVPDNFTLIPWRGKMASDGVRYKVLGNAQSINVVRWIGWRIQWVQEATDGES